jgi:hypothetical protein
VETPIRISSCHRTPNLPPECETEITTKTYDTVTVVVIVFGQFVALTDIGYGAESSTILRRNMRAPFSESKNKSSKKQGLCYLRHKVLFLLSFAYPSTLKEEAICSPETSLDFSTLRGVLHSSISSEYFTYGLIYSVFFFFCRHIVVL